MVVLTNSIEGVTPSGTTLTQGSGGNTGGLSGSFFDSVTVGTGVTLASDNTQAAHGSLSLKVATGATSASSWVQWDASAGSLTTVWFRLYLYFTAFPAANLKLIQFLNVSTQCGCINLNTTGKIDHVIGTGSTATNTGSVAINLNQWMRLEGFIVASATVGQIEHKLFTIADSPQPAEVLTDAATGNTNTVVTKTRIGIPVAGTNIGPFWLDDFGLSDSSYLGPYIVSSAQPVRPGQTWTRLFRHSQRVLPPALAPAATQTVNLTTAQVNVNALTPALQEQLALSVAQVNISAPAPALRAQLSLPVAQVNVNAPAPSLQARLNLTAAQVNTNALAPSLREQLALAPAQLTVGALAPSPRVTLTLGVAQQSVAALVPALRVQPSLSLAQINAAAYPVTVAGSALPPLGPGTGGTITQPSPGGSATWPSSGGAAVAPSTGGSVSAPLTSGSASSPSSGGTAG